MSESALENYGEQYRDRTFTVRARYTHSCSVGAMASDPTGHPGFDEGAGSPLYGSELNFDLYEWEMVSACIHGNVGACALCVAFLKKAGAR
jgi:hypothetical protein